MNETIDCTNCCISDFKHSLCDCNGDFCTKYKSIGDENDFMQAVLADRPSGKWIEVDDASISCRCSVCGWEAHLYEDDVYGMPYCPNCGCRMKGADNEVR